MIIDFTDQILLLPLLQERDFLNYCLRRYIAGPYPSGDMAQDAFDSEVREMEDRLEQVCRILKRRYNL